MLPNLLFEVFLHLRHHDGLKEVGVFLGKHVRIDDLINAVPKTDLTLEVFLLALLNALAVFPTVLNEVIDGEFLLRLVPPHAFVQGEFRRQLGLSYNWVFNLHLNFIRAIFLGIENCLFMYRRLGLAEVLNGFDFN